MANSEAGTSTSNPLGGEYQVFLSFRGPDTRCGFADTLYTALREVGIRVFLDDEALRPGEIISGSLLRGIDDSQIYIPIFSPNYASSHWCLRELARMVENTSKSREDGDKKVILPIFYNVKPDDVKLKTELYTKAIAKLEQKTEDQQKWWFFRKKKKFSTEDVETWRGALREVDGTKGLELEKYRGDGHLSKSVVNEVTNRLRIKERKVTEALVGMADPIAAITKLLDIDSGDVRLIGIYGMGGIGKTTLAKTMFNQLCPRFANYCSFLDDVGEKAKNKGLVELQRLLLSDFSNSDAAKDIRNIDDGIDRIGDTIRNKKVLIVLDDVNEVDQIQNLVGVDSLCPGTRILVTTRDIDILNIREFKYKIMGHEMEGLSDKDALQLFSTHAFNYYPTPADFSALSKDIVSTAGGLPLALQAIGSSLYQKDKLIWGERLEKLRKTPNKDVRRKLKITYDALETDEQQIFLDVACFCIGQSKTDAVFAWEGCGFKPMHAIDVLINRFMIKVLDDDSLWMHDQFRDLGRVIANQHPVKHMRLWDRDEIICQLNSTEVNSTEIKKSVQTLCLRAHFRNPITVTVEQIKQFPHLRFLWLSNVICKGDFKGCLSELKWIVLHYAPLFPKDYRYYGPENLRLQKVVVVNLSYLDFIENEVRYLIGGAAKLKVLTLQDCQLVREMPNFYGNPVLKKLAISGCRHLEEIGCSIGELRELTELSFKWCRLLRKLPEQIGELKNLQHLSLRGCRRISVLPDSIGRLPCLLTLDLENCNRIGELPQLPRSLTTLWLPRSLPTLRLKSGSSNPSDTSGCSQSRTRKMVFLFRSPTRIFLALPPDFGSLRLLKELYLGGVDLQTFTQFPPNLIVLDLYDTQGEEIQLDGLPQLETLTVCRCDDLKRLSIASSLRKLIKIGVSSCVELVEVQFLSVSKSMERLYTSAGTSLGRSVSPSEELQEIQFVSSLGRSVSPSEELQEIQFVSTLESLEVFSVKVCPSLRWLRGLPLLKNLKQLRIEDCHRLQVVEGVDELEFLDRLRVKSCRSMERIIDASSSKIPNGCQIKIHNCRKLLNTGPNGSSVPWESYREKILNGPEIGDDKDDGITKRTRRE